MFRTMIAALTLAAVVACGRDDRSDTAAADSLSRDLQLAPVDTSAELNDRPTAGAPAPATRTPARPSRPAASPSTPAPSASTPSPAAPVATTASLAAGTNLSAATTAEIRSHK